MRTIKEYIGNPSRTFRGIGYHIITSLVPFLSDSFYLKLIFRNRLGYSLNLDNPKTFNEKIQWLKLESRKHPEYTKMVDKVSAKDYVSSIIGKEYIIKTLGVWNSVDEIEWEKLPNQFCIKSSNDSGGVVVCKDKATLNIESAKKKLSHLGSRDYTKYNKEFPYRNVPQRIIAEEYKEDESGFELKDYKIFCFNGEPKMIFVGSDRQLGKTKFDFYDLDWNHLPIQQEYPNNPNGIPKPKNLRAMLDVAKKLSAGFAHLRVDLYNCNGKIYFGELTFFHNSGLFPWNPTEWDYKLGEWLKLPIETAL